MSKTFLSSVQSARLVNLIETEYSASKASDVSFAKIATEKLGFEVNNHHVHSRRVELGIPLNTPHSADETRIARCERDGAALAEAVAELTRKLDIVIKALNLKMHFEGGQGGNATLHPR